MIFIPFSHLFIGKISMDLNSGASAIEEQGDELRVCDSWSCFITICVGYTNPSRCFCSKNYRNFAAWTEDADPTICHQQSLG